MPFTPQGAFAFTHAAQVDDPSWSAATAKANLDSQVNELKTTLNNLITALQSSTAADSSAAFIGSESIVGLTGTTIRSQLADLITKLKAITDGSSGADFVNSTAIAGVTGTTVQSQLESIKSLIDLIYTKAQLDAGQLDNRYFTESELQSIIDSASGADKIGATQVATGSGTTTQAILEWLYTQIVNTTLGQIANDSLTNAKLATDIKVGSLAALTTTDKSSVVAAVNEHVADIVTTPAANKILKLDAYGEYPRSVIKQADTANDKNIFAKIIDMHYQILRGVGFHALESSDLNLSKTITAPAAKGTRAVTINDVTNLYQGQLIVYYSNSEYYTNVIDSISGLTINLVYPLEVATAINDTLHNFYINSSHPNLYGYKAIADTALRNLIKPTGKRLYKRILPTDFTFSGTGSVGDGGFVQDYTEPFGTVDTKVLTTTGVQTEVATNVLYLERDMYLKFRTYVKIGSGATLNYQISNTTDTIAYYSKNKTVVGVGRTEVIEVVTYLRKGNYNFKLQSTTPGIIVIGKTEIFELSSKHDLADFDKGVHLCLGDSWFAIELATPYYLIARLEERLPNATFINFGVGGNEIDNLLRRFNGTATDADINNDPATYGNRKNATTIPVIDYVWVMCGTNDYFASTTSSAFKSGMDDLMKEIIDRGAKPLIFTSSVGQVGSGTKFTLSREYADLYYNDVDTDGFKQGTWTPRLEGLTTPGTNTYTTQSGTYYKIGKMVVAQFNVTLSAKDAAMAGPVLIKGLPYIPAAGYFSVSFGQVENVAIGGTTYTQYGGFATGTSEIILTKMAGSTGSWDNILPAIIANNSAFRGSVTYFID